jgi:hypothetical protein
VEAFQRLIVHLLLVLFVALSVPIAILVVLVALATECIVHRRQAVIGAVPRNSLAAAREQ